MGRKRSNVPYIVQLLDIMSPGERKIAEGHFCTIANQSNPQGLILIRTILKYLDEDQSSVSDGVELIVKRVYNDFPEQRICNLSNRIIQRLHESLLLDVNLNRDSNFDPLTRLSLNIQKRVLELRVLFQKGVLEKVPRMLAQLEKRTSDLELFAVQLDLLNLKHEYLLSIDKLSELLPVSVAIEECEGKIRAIRLAKSFLSMTFREDELESDLQNISALESRIANLNSFESAYSSLNLEFYRRFLEIKLHERKKEYETALELGQALLNRVVSEPMLSSVDHVGRLKLQLSRLELILYEPELALDRIQELKEILPVSSNAFSKVLEAEFLANFYNGNFQRSEEILLGLMGDQGGTTPIDQSRSYWNDHYSFVLFALDRYQEASRWMALDQGGNRYSGDASAIRRVLQIMVSIEQKQIREAEAGIENLRKFLAYAKRKKQQLRGRWEFFYAIFRQLIRNNYDFSRTCKDCRPELRSLSSNELPFKWVIHSSELLPLHFWFLQKNENPVSPRPVTTWQQTVNLLASQPTVSLSV